MPDITLSQLIRMTPMDEATKKEILRKVETLDEDQKYRLSMVCWKAIANEYDLNLVAETDKILNEVAEGKRQYNVNDFTEEKARQDIRFSGKVEKAKTEEDLIKVEAQLEGMKQTSSSNPQPTTHNPQPSSSPPPSKPA